MTLAKKSAASLLVLISFLPNTLAAQKDKEEDEPTSNISFLVVKDYNGKPIRNAAVVMHPVNKHDKQERGGLELKTDMDGKASFEGLPYGKLRVQVLANGFQTYGEDFDINQPKTDLTIKLKRPQGQFSVYDDNSGAKKDDKPADPNAKPQ